MAEDLILDCRRIQVGELEVRTHELHDVEAPPTGCQNEITAHPETGQIRLHDLLLGELIHSEHFGVETGHHGGEPLEIVRIGIGNDVEVFGCAGVAVCADRKSANHDKVNVRLVKCGEKALDVKR